MGKDEPQGELWERPLDEVPLAFLDLEMTGLELARDRVVEVCIERVVGGVCVDRVESLVWPGDDRAGGASEVHGLSAEVLAGAPPFETIAGDVRRILEGAVPVAHAAPWDARFLRQELDRAGHPMELEHWVDTLALSRRSFLLPNHSLVALRTHFGLPCDAAHRASGDVRALRDIFARCCEVLKPTSAKDLWETRIHSERARAAIVAQLQAAAESGAPVKVASRGAGRPIREMVVRVTALELEADPPRALGYTLPGRARVTLRLDRVVRAEPSSEP